MRTSGRLRGCVSVCNANPSLSMHIDMGLSMICSSIWWRYYLWSGIINLIQIFIRLHLFILLIYHSTRAGGAGNADDVMAGNSMEDVEWFWYRVSYQTELNGNNIVSALYLYCADIKLGVLLCDELDITSMNWMEMARDTCCGNVLRGCKLSKGKWMECLHCKM